MAEKVARPHHKVELADLIAAGFLEPGTSLVPRRKALAHRVGVLLPDGRIEIEGTAFESATAAATWLRGKKVNGWWLFLVDPVAKRSLRDVWRDYVNRLAVDVDDDDADDEVEEEES